MTITAGLTNLTVSVVIVIVIFIDTSFINTCT